MALLQKIKEKLGFGTGSAERDETDTEVTVESDPAADNDAGTDDREEAEPAAAGTEAAASTGSLVDEEPNEVDGSGTDESGSEEAASDEVDDESGSEEAESDDDADESDDDADESDDDAVDDESGDTDVTDTAAEQAEAADAGTEAVAVDDDDVGTDLEELKGIGPAYAERLAEIGIESVEDLAAADAEAVAEGASVGESRAATWIERASEF